MKSFGVVHWLFAFAVASSVFSCSLAKKSKKPLSKNVSTASGEKGDEESAERLAEGQIRFSEANCSLSDELIKEIKGYQPIADKIMDALKKGEFKGKVYKELETFLNRFGNRMSGTDNLERSIDYMISQFESWGLKVETEPVEVPTWARGREEATLYMEDGDPGRPWRSKPIKILGLGLSDGTPANGVYAEVLVVGSFDELKDQGSNVEGKIVLLNAPFTTYGETAKYRVNGAAEVGKLNGSIALVRSVTPFSIQSLHTGMMSYDKNPKFKRIPGAAISMEDAKFMERMQAAGKKMYMKVVMNDYVAPPGTRMSRNTIATLVGSSKPDSAVFMSGHIDSWDVGEGAMDDASGMMISAYALKVFKSLNLQAKRSLQAVIFTGEEVGMLGGKVFYTNRKNTLNNINAAFESDEGTFTPVGLNFNGNDEAACIVQEVAKLLAPIGASRMRKMDSVGSDIEYLQAVNVPSVSLDSKNDKYFWYHHTTADFLSVYTPEELDLGAATFAVTSFVLADLSVDLPRDAIPSSNDIAQVGHEKLLL